MDKPWKVVTAFLGVFIAGAVFGGFFVLGFGARLLPAAAPTPVAPVASAPAPSVTPATTTTAGASVTGAATPAPKVQRPSLLQVPQAWQAPQLMRRYADRLDLTPEQKEHIDPLIQRASEDYARSLRSLFRETGIIVQRLQQDIRKELTPAQITELDKLEQRQKEILEKAEQRQREQKKAPGKIPGMNRKAKEDSKSAPATSSGTPAAASSTTMPASSAEISVTPANPPPSSGEKKEE